MTSDGFAGGGGSEPRLLANIGCGPAGGGALPSYFQSWRQLRIDVDAAVQPDVVADITDLSQVPANSASAVWAAHCIEHLYPHQIALALAECHRVLNPEGFLCVLVPDLQTIANYIVADRLHEAIYQSAAGPVTAHDVLFGFGPAIAQGRLSMAHHCGFTPTMMLRCFDQSPFAEVVLRRRPATLELAAVARKREARDNAEREALLAALEL